MNIFLLLVLVQISGGAYDTEMFPMPSMERCLITAAEVEKSIPARAGISYALTCIKVRSTSQVPV